jgi:MFS family permease
VENTDTRSPGSRQIALACALLFGAMLNLTLIVAGLKELVVGRLGGTLTDAALFFTVEMTAYLVFGPLWGLLSDRVGRRRPFVVCGFAASGLLYLSFLAIDSIPLLLVLRFLQGGAAIAGWSTAMAIVLDGGESSPRSRRAGLAGASLILGVGTGAPLGGLLTHALGPTAPLVAAGALFLVLAGAALALREPAELREPTGIRTILRDLGARPRLLLPAALYFAERFTVGLFVVVFPIYLAEKAGADPAARGRLLALFLFPFAAGQLGSYRLTRRFGPLPPIAVGAAAYGLAFGALGRVPVGSLPFWMVALGLLAAVIFPPTLALIAEWSTPESRASAVAAFNVAGSAGFALGPVTGAWIAGLAGFSAAFTSGGVIIFSAALLVLARLLFARRRDGSAE